MSIRSTWTRWLILDRGRLLARIAELDGYLNELHQIVPATFADYQRIEKRRACERLLQIAVEAVIDICGLLVTGLRLGLPGEEDDVFDKLERAGVMPAPMMERLRKMKGLRNLLVHGYGRIDDRIVFELLQTRLDDFTDFRALALQRLR
jgi:uncharacterized protein YutE (UPF0331/DUF86 family)